MLLKNKKKAQVTLFLVFMISSIIVVLVAAFFAPMAVRFNTEMYRVGEELILESNESISQIQNETTKARIQGIFGNSLAAVENNISVNNSLFQYGWILVIALGALVVFLFTRQLVEFRNPGNLV
jgi:predicted PurR-regulated permease PerM